MRTLTWVAIISIILNMILAVLLTDKFNQDAVLTSDNQVSIKTMADEVTEKINIPELIVEETKQEASNRQFGSVVAMINNIEVKQLELLPYLNEVIPADQIDQFKSFETIPEAFKKSAVDSYAVDLLFENLAIDKRIVNNDRLQALLNKNRRRSIRTAYLSTISSTLVSEDQIKIKYDKLVKSLVGKKEYHARHILLASEKEANIISKALSKKERSFEELAQLFSLDESTAYKGGDLGYQVMGQLNPKFEQIVSKLKLNTYSKPFKTDLGWHIAIVNNRRDAEIMPYEQAKTVIRNNLQQQAIKTLAKRLIEDANIKLIKL